MSEGELSSRISQLLSKLEQGSHWDMLHAPIFADSSKPLKERIFALGCLSHSNNPDTFALMQLLLQKEDEPEGLRAEIAGRLSWVLPKGVLAYAAKCGSEKVREATFDSLGRAWHRCEKCVSFLAGLLDAAESPETRLRATRALGKLGKMPYISSTNFDARREREKACEMIIPILTRLVGDSSGEVSSAAVDGLVEIGPSSVPALLDVLMGKSSLLPNTSRMRKASLNILGSIDRKCDQESRIPVFSGVGLNMEQLSGLLFSINRRNKKDAGAYFQRKIAYLPKSPSLFSHDSWKYEPVVPLLISALSSRKPYVRLHATLALGNIVDSSAAPALSSQLEGLLGKGTAKGVYSELISETLAALGKINTPLSVQAVLSALGSPSTTVRVRAVKTLGEAGQQEAIVPLLGMLVDEASGVRDAAIAALPNFEPQNIGHLRLLAAQMRGLKRLGNSSESESLGIRMQLGDAMEVYKDWSSTMRVKCREKYRGISPPPRFRSPPGRRRGKAASARRMVAGGKIS